MKYAIIALLVLLSACMQSPEDTLEAPGDAPDAMPGLNGQQQTGTHNLCENGSCIKVNGCPDGYDEFQSQIGPACVLHYGQAEIGSWQLCAKSSDGCSCTYVSRDTTGEQLTWGSPGEGLRCAPENYRDYMVHGGMSGVDENGEDYAMIA